MRNNFLIGIMTMVWLALMANIIWQGTDGKWHVEDAKKIGQLEVAKYTDQIIVVAVSDEEARLCFYERVLEKDNNLQNVLNVSKGEAESIKERWTLVLETEALIGENGLGKTKEGDGKTPIGVFRFTNAFGVLQDPGTKMDYVQVNENHYWVDDGGSKYYNQFVSADEMEQDWTSAELICEYGESYHYVLATSYNSECIPGRGSAVFLHCTSESAEATAGCVAVPEIYMQKIIKCVKPQCVFIIDYVDKILEY